MNTTISKPKGDASNHPAITIETSSPITIVSAMKIINKFYSVYINHNSLKQKCYDIIKKNNIIQFTWNSSKTCGDVITKNFDNYVFERRLDIIFTHPDGNNVILTITNYTKIYSNRLDKESVLDRSFIKVFHDCDSDLTILKNVPIDEIPWNQLDGNNDGWVYYDFICNLINDIVSDHEIWDMIKDNLKEEM